MLKVNIKAICGYIQWLGLKNDGRMESDRGLIRQNSNSDFIEKYVSPDEKFTAVYSHGTLVQFAMDKITVYVHVYELNGKPITVTWSAWDSDTDKGTDTFVYL